MRILQDGHWVAVSQPSPEGSEETSLCLKRKLVQEIVCSASSTMSRVVAIVFSFPHCVIEYFPNRLGVEQLQIPVLVESIVSPTLDAILSAEKLVRGSFGDLWRNTFGDFQSNNPLNSDQADRNSENERMSTIYYKIQRFLFSGNISSCLLPPFLFNSELVKERTDVERPESTDITDVNMSSYSERTVYIALLPVVQFIRSCSFSGVTFRFPNPNFAFFSSERDENEDTFRLTANMGEESFDDLLSLQESSACLSRPADQVLIERCTAKRTYQKGNNIPPKDSCISSEEVAENCTKTDTMLFRYSHEYCSICLDNYGNGDCLRVLPCLHFYHVTCIDKWLVTDKACPLCKWDIDRGLLYSTWEDNWNCGQPTNDSSADTTCSAIDLIEQEPEIKWGEWFRNLFSSASWCS